MIFLAFLPGIIAVILLSKYVSDLNSDIESAMADIDRDLWKCVLFDMSSNKDKASAIELQQEIANMNGGSRKRTITKSEENPNGMLITPEMGGKIVLSVLQEGKGHISHVSAEI